MISASSSASLKRYCLRFFPAPVFSARPAAWPGLPDGLPITGVAGDQQASLVGQGCLQPGQAKCTYGTGAFLLVHTGSQPVRSTQGLVSTVAATLDPAERAVCARRQRVHRRRGRAVVSRRPGSRRRVARDQPPEPSGQPGERGSVRARSDRPGSAHWEPQARGTMFGLTRAPAWPTWPGPLSKASPTRSPT